MVILILTEITIRTQHQIILVEEEEVEAEVVGEEEEEDEEDMTIMMEEEDIIILTRSTERTITRMMMNSMNGRKDMRSRLLIASRKITMAAIPRSTIRRSQR